VAVMHVACRVFTQAGVLSCQPCLVDQVWYPHPTTTGLHCPGALEGGGLACVSQVCYGVGFDMLGHLS
jgi:hypothetical protein